MPVSNSLQTDCIFQAASQADVSDIQELMNSLYKHDPNVAHVRPDISLTFQEFQRKPDKGMLVAIKCNETIAGYAILVFFWSNEYGGNLIEIDELSIAEQFQGKGIGQTFFAWLCSEFADSKGWTLQVSDSNPRARALYERLGFRTSRNTHMIRIFQD